MKLTKYEHACLIIDNDTSRLVIDPGSFTNLPEDLTNIACVIVTEEHFDHFNADNLRAIIHQSPDAKIYTTAAVHDQLTSEGVNSEAMQSGTVHIGGFSVSFYETDHAPVYRVSPCRSLSVKIDDYLYYPSDSFNTIDDEVEILALPTGGPWNKAEHTIDFANAMKSKQIIATHNGLYNDIGNTVVNNNVINNLTDKSRVFTLLAPGETLQS